MFNHVQRELNELIAIVHQTAQVNAAFALDPKAKRSETTIQDHARNEARKVQLMEKYELTSNPVYAQRPVMAGQ